MEYKIFEEEEKEFVPWADQSIGQINYGPDVLIVHTVWIPFSGFDTLPTPMPSPWAYGSL